MSPERETESLAGVRFVRLPNANAVGEQAALMVADQLANKPNSTLVFPTGKTPLPLYQALRHMPELDWHSSRLFQLDEYVKPKMAGPLPYETFAEFMDRELWDYIAGHKFYIQHYFQQPAAYEQLVLQGGGPDLVILGIGGNGHVAFNEPGSAPDSPTRVIELAEQTMISNFGGARKPGYPTQAMTLGLKAIFSAREILLLATGDSKKAIVKEAFSPENPPSVDCPASWLKRHPHVTVITDFEV